VTVQVSVGGHTVNLIPVLGIDVKMTPASTHYLANKASHTARLLTLMKTVLPAVLLIVGVILVVVALLRRKPARPADQDRAATKGTSLQLGSA
jgi:hypothetical protein